MIKAVFLDMDNTLLETEELYDQAKFRLFDYLEDFGILRAESVPVFDKIDRELYKTYGYSRLRQPQIFEDTLKHFVPDADAELIGTVRAWADEIFEREARIRDGVLEAIEKLAAEFPLYIVTAGDLGVQQGRVEKLPFLDKIKEVHIVEKKDPGVYERIITELQLHPEAVVMIGDSMASDILPATKAGLKAIWIEAHNFQMEKVHGITLPDNAVKHDTLLDAAHTLVTHRHIKTPDQNPAPKPPKQQP